MRELVPWLTLIFRDKRRLVVGALLILLTLVSGLGLLALSGWFITATAVTGMLLAAGIAAQLNIYTPGGGIRLFAVTRTVGRYLERVYNHDTVLRLLAALRVTLFQALSSVPGFQRQHLKGADWLARLTSDVDVMDTLYLRLVAPTLLALLLTGGLIAVALFVYSPLMAGFVGALLVLAFLLSTAALHLRNGEVARQRVDGQNALRERLIDQLRGQAELTAAGLLAQTHEDLARQASIWSTDQSRLGRNIAWHRALSGICINLAVLVALWVGLELYRGGAISGPVAVLMPLMLLGMAEVLGPLPDAFGVLGSTQAAARRLNAVSNAEGGEDRGRHSDTAGGTQDASLLLSFQDVSVCREGQVVALEGVTAAIRCGEWVGVVGASGSGKSTLLDVAAGLVEATGGVIARGAGLQRVAYLEQQTVIFNDTVRRNLVPDGRQLDDALIWRTLALVRLDERISQIPGQLDGWLGRLGSQLSGGEARRIALARTLLREADLVVLDEPFTGVDAATSAAISCGMRQYLEGRTLLVAAHDASAMPEVDRLLMLQPPRGE
ncbi:thiol reductant ABC exporter subunit CydC [Marinobacter zhejiangensis]|uniref:ATP-binding cassette, subfamily C, CydC n=1 Tax=Marinobacter zhejiangensis TaxID=488535 RepID=A0A1I4RXM7_9GAMM|nr:thiol reductant ABC exporter subunit CydC [Marinobacter zhejiangensis]SFM56957.1 ATP-binding cassette, subfamily C, CydC [Marinobacter zhejiangensis]